MSDPRTSSVYAGRNLAYVRDLLGMPPKYASADEAYRAVPGDDFTPMGPPPAGAVVYYESVTSPHGNIAIAVGHDMVLTCSPEGMPRLYWYDDNTLGPFRGWSWKLGRDPIPTVEQEEDDDQPG